MFINGSFSLNQQIVFNKIKQIKLNRYVILLNSGLLLSFFVLGIYAKLVGGDTGRAVSFLFEDYFSIERPYFGLFTNLSEILWCLSATICLFTCSLLKHIQPRQTTDPFIFFSGMGIIFLLVDDIFRLTLVLQVYAGIPKLIMYFLYGVAAIAYSLSFRRRLLSSPYPLLIIAGVLLVISGVADVLPLPGKGTPAMLEDGTKLIALLNITLYFWQVCTQRLRYVLRLTISQS